MPVYEYHCQRCENVFDVVKPLAHLNDPEFCSCGSDKTKRQISRTHFYGAGDWDKAEYNPAFGKIIKNSKHRAEEAKARGWLEVGNEDFNRTVASQDKKLNDNIEEATKSAYDSLEYGLKKDYLANR